MRYIEHQWQQLQNAAPEFVGRERERKELLDRLSEPGNIVELVSGPGMGKTSLLSRVALDAKAAFGGTVEYFSGSPAFALSQAIDVIADALRNAQGHSVLVIDDADALDFGDTLNAINRLTSGPWSLSTILTSRTGTGISNSVVRLGPLDPNSFRDMLIGMFKGALDQAGMDQLWEASKGNAAVARLLSERWRARKAPDIEELLSILKPWQAPVLFGPNGKALRAGETAERRIITDVREVSDTLLRQISENPRLLYDLPPRRFEELAAELLERAGYSVTLTPQTRDGGKDLHAVRHDQFGSFLVFVECKRYAPDNPVGVGIVRALHGVTQVERANAAMVLTTSFFTGPAKDFARDIRYQMSLKDYFDLRTWIDEHRSR